MAKQKQQHGCYITCRVNASDTKKQLPTRTMNSKKLTKFLKFIDSPDDMYASFSRIQLLHTSPTHLDHNSQTSLDHEDTLVVL